MAAVASHVDPSAKELASALSSLHIDTSMARTPPYLPYGEHRLWPRNDLAVGAATAAAAAALVPPTTGAAAAAAVANRGKRGSVSASDSLAIPLTNEESKAKQSKRIDQTKEGRKNKSKQNETAKNRPFVRPTDRQTDRLSDR